MGTDSVKLFNKALADQILSMELASLTHFLEEKVSFLQQKPFNLSLVLFEMDQNGGSVAEAIARLLSSEQTFTQLRSDVAQDFAFGDTEIYLDYWSCYAHVFSDHPDLSISSVDYLPDQEEETFLLLRPQHIAQMIASLREHGDDLTVMSTDDIKKLEDWMNFCVADPRYMLSYHFDY